MASSGESQSAIAALHARGWTDSAIGRAVGRDSSLIHQISAGKKPGNNLAPALGALRESGAAAPKTAKNLPNVALPAAPRRQTAQGMPARVRLSRGEKGTREPRGSGERLPNGARRIQGHTKASGRFAASLAAGLSDHARIKIAFRDTRGLWHQMGERGGFKPELLREALRSGRSWRDVLAELIARLKYRRPNAPEPDGEVEFYIIGLGEG